MNYKPVYDGIKTKLMKMRKLTVIQIFIAIVQKRLKAKETVKIKNQIPSHIQSVNNKVK
jgi:hypothetical protein